jgi:phosphoglycolate phosphatase-like HAD superfamily hydrolase
MDVPGTVIFDFDGTLADSMLVSMNTSNLLAPVFGFRTVTEAEVPRLRKMSIPELFRHLELPIPRLPVILARARREMSRQIAGIRLFDGMAAVIERLKASGVQIGVVTSNSVQNVQDCLRSNGVLDLFDFVHSATNLFGKHRALRSLMRRRALPPGAVVYVGDEARDIEASRRCRIPVIAVSWGFQDRAKLAQLQPDFIADVPADLERFVRAILCAPIRG